MSAAVVTLLAQRIDAQPTAAQILSEMYWSQDDQSRVVGGEFVMTDVSAVTPRDLSVRMAFLMTLAPDPLFRRVLAGDFIGTDPQVVSSGELVGAGSLSDLAGLHLSDGAARALTVARPGPSLNLSSSELAAFNALRGAPTETVQLQLQQMLLERYRAYRAAGLAGIAPYDRGDRTTDVSEELRTASDAAGELKKYLPELQQQLIAYPQPMVTALEQRFRWLQYDIDGATTFVLMHEMGVAAGAARALVQRQYYVSTGYNAEQAVAGLLPVEAGTIVVYTNHTFTDQVGGFGAAVKRGIGRRVMSNKLKQMFDATRTQIRERS
ncbi:MAG: hypothetical protein ACRERC_18105 [Candidatus Binatia bacterium]